MKTDRYRLQKNYDIVSDKGDDTDVTLNTKKELNEHIESTDLEWRVGFLFKIKGDDSLYRFIWNKKPKKGSEVMP